MDDKSDSESSAHSETHKHATVQSLPSDYSDVQPENYDPEYISKISNSMQVPDKIPVLGGKGGTEEDSVPSLAWQHASSRDMMVPDRIFIAGGGEHVGARQGLRHMDFEFPHHSQHTGNGYVGLITPPHTLTLEEQFPVVEDGGGEAREHSTSQVVKVANGAVATHAPYTPGVSTSDSLLLNEEDEATQLRTHVAKLSRRVTVMEQEVQSRSQREMMLYSSVFGYFVLKFFWWLFRNK